MYPILGTAALGAVVETVHGTWLSSVFIERYLTVIDLYSGTWQSSILCLKRGTWHSSVPREVLNSHLPLHRYLTVLCPKDVFDSRISQLRYLTVLCPYTDIWQSSTWLQRFGWESDVALPTLIIVTIKDQVYYAELSLWWHTRLRGWAYRPSYHK